MLFSLFAAGCSAAAAAAFVVRAAVRITYPYLTNLGEPALAQSIRFLRLGIWPYHDLSQPPYSVVPYGPVYLVLSGWVQSFFSEPMAGGRLVCLTASVVSAVGIGLMVYRGSRSRIPAVGAGAFFLSLPFVERWGAQVNVDMTAVAVELTALCAFFFYASSDYREKKYFWIGTVAAVAAVFTKSSAAAAAAAWAAHLLLTRRWRDLMTFAVIAGGSAAVIYTVLNLATGGQYYFHTTYEIGRRLFFTRFIADYWKQTLWSQPLNAAAAAAALAWPAFWRGKDNPQRLLNLYLVLTILLTVSLGKQGSDTNYLLPFIAASTLAAGRLWSLPASGLGRSIASVVAAGVVVQVLGMGGLPHFSIRETRKGLEDQKVFYDQLSKVIRQFPDPIISWDMSLLIANGRPVYFEPFPMAQAAYSKAWDQTPILNDLRSEKINLVITYFWSQALIKDRNFTPEFIQELRAHYVLIGRTAVPWAKNQLLFLYIPRRLQGKH